MTFFSHCSLALCYLSLSLPLFLSSSFGVCLSVLPLHCVVVLSFAPFHPLQSKCEHLKVVIAHFFRQTSKSDEDRKMSL